MTLERANAFAAAICEIRGAVPDELGFYQPFIQAWGMKKRTSAAKKPLYIVLISVHGLIRGHDLELGRDADTGGQTKYVVELARALGERADVEKVVLLTRRVIDTQVSPDYAELLEALSEKASIVRIECGEEKYLRKEMLWDSLESFSDNALAYLKGQPRLPDVIHSHYADAGYVGSRLSHQLGVPLVHTGHSLGRTKRSSCWPAASSAARSKRPTISRAASRPKKPPSVSPSASSPARSRRSSSNTGCTISISPSACG